MAIQSKQIALAAEAVNRLHGLSPLCRRVMLELINRVDRNTGTCKPSQGRLAVSLGCDERSVRRAMVEAREAGLLYWRNPGHHKRSIFQVMFSRLAEIAQNLKRQIRETAVAAIAKGKQAQALRLRRYREKRIREYQQVMCEHRLQVTSADRTKSSAIPTTHNSFNHSGGENRQENLANNRLWGDIRSKGFHLLQFATSDMPDSLWELALEKERVRFGAGIEIVQDAYQGACS